MGYGGLFMKHAMAAAAVLTLALCGCAGFDGNDAGATLQNADAGFEVDERVIYLDDARFVTTAESVLTDAPAEVLSGSWSLKGEWTGAGDYHAFLYTDRTVLPLKAGATYRLTFDYRMLTLPDRGFETIFYSPTAGNLSQWLSGSLLTETDSPSGTAMLEATLLDYPDYQIRWNIVGNGAIAIDNIRVEELIGGAAATVAVSVAEVDLEATEAVTGVTRETIQAKLEHRATIPVFYPWGRGFGPESSDADSTPYGLLWTGEGIARDLESTRPELGTRDRVLMHADPDTLRLISLDWHYWSPAWRTLSRNSPFYLDEIYDFHVGSEYARTLMINFEHRDWPALMGKKAENYRKTGYDGVMLDWWHDGAGNGRSPERVQKARLAILKAMREGGGESFILLGNVNWSMDDPTSKYLSGVFLELWKSKPGHSYALTYGDESDTDWNPSIERMEDVLRYWDGALQWPRIVAMEPWKVTAGDYVASRDSAENLAYAKLFAAMACVIPENGYFLYADNNDDWDGGDHQHSYYDFYRTDLGRPVSRMNEAKEGVAWREYEKGYIAYNRTAEAVDMPISGGRRLVLAPLEGIFVEESIDE